MSKPIKITDEFRLLCMEEFAEALQKMRMSDGKISFSKTLENKERKATVYFTPEAWAKMTLLVKGFDKEVAWHGVATRGEDPEKDEYVISDVLVYPQEVTSATVDTDQKQYEEWLCNLPDDVFNNLRMQGHSHVNMAVNPSGVDTGHQSKILQQLDDDMFYIFMIWNKSFSSWFKIYDFAKNTMFENADVSVKLLGSGFDPDAFMAEARGLVRNMTPSYTPGYQPGQVYTPGSGYSYQRPPAQNQGQTPAAPAQSKPVAKDEKKSPDAGKDGWRSGGAKGSDYSYGGKYGSWDDDDDIYGDGYWGAGYSAYDRCLRDPFYARGT